MSVTHPDTQRNYMADYIVDLLDGGDLFITTSDGTTEVAKCVFGTPAFGAAGASVAGRADVANISPDADAAGGVAAKAFFRKSDTTKVVNMTVGATGSGEDIELSNTTIGVNDTVTVNSLTYAAAP